MKKSMRTIACMALASIALTACNNQTSKVDEAPAATKTTTEGVKIAYVEVDSIMTQYKFCKEYSAILEKKSQNIQNTVNAKGRALQNAAAKFQQDIQSNKYTQQQAEAVQAGLRKQDADLQALQQRLGSEFQAETEKFNKALRTHPEQSGRQHPLCRQSLRHHQRSDCRFEQGLQIDSGHQEINRDDTTSATRNRA